MCFQIPVKLTENDFSGRIFRALFPSVDNDPNENRWMMASIVSNVRTLKIEKKILLIKFNS